MEEASNKPKSSIVMEETCNKPKSCKGKRSKRKRKGSQSEEDEPAKKKDAFLSSKYAEPPVSKIYNSRFKKHAPAELFRKDLISAMKLPDSEPLDPDDYWVIDDAWRPEWERGVQVPVDPESLPEPSAVEFRKKKNTNFKLPRKLIRTAKDAQFSPNNHILSFTSALSDQTCRYDMDDVDTRWLEIINEDRDDFGLEPIEESVVEKVMEEIEDLCYDNMQEAIREDPNLNMENDEDVVCDVCRSPDSLVGNEIVFCDACNMSVHQSCYGILRIPEGSWICRTCALGIRPSCILCPNRGGAMKLIKSGERWCHVSCAIWMPEVSVGSIVRMEPILNVSLIPAFRWSSLCCICEKRNGACITCSAKNCRVSYHVTCAFKVDLRMRAIANDKEDGLKLKSYCPKHVKEYDAWSDGEEKPKDEESKEKKREESDVATEENPNPTRDQILQEREDNFQNYAGIEELVSICPFDKAIVETIYNYWLLKRRANFNRPLLRPREISVAASFIEESGTYNAVKKMVTLRRDLERARNLCYMITKREKTAKTWVEMKHLVFEKQKEIVDKNSHCLTKDELSAVVRANSENLAFEKKHSGINGPSPTTLNVLNTLIGEENTKVQLNGMLTKSKKKSEKNQKKNLPNPYAKHYLNGLLKRSQRWLATAGQQKWESSESAAEKSPAPKRQRHTSCTITSEPVASEDGTKNTEHVEDASKADVIVSLSASEAKTVPEETAPESSVEQVQGSPSLSFVPSDTGNDSVYDADIDEKKLVEKVHEPAIECEFSEKQKKLHVKPKIKKLLNPEIKIKPSPSLKGERHSSCTITSEPVTSDTKDAEDIEDDGKAKECLSASENKATAESSVEKVQDIPVQSFVSLEIGNDSMYDADIEKKPVVKVLEPVIEREYSEKQKKLHVKPKKKKLLNSEVKKNLNHHLKPTKRKKQKSFSISDATLLVNAFKYDKINTVQKKSPVVNCVPDSKVEVDVSVAECNTAILMNGFVNYIEDQKCQEMDLQDVISESIPLPVIKGELGEDDCTLQIEGTGYPVCAFEIVVDTAESIENGDPESLVQSSLESVQSLSSSETDVTSTVDSPKTDRTRSPLNNCISPSKSTLNNKSFKNRTHHSSPTHVNNLQNSCSSENVNKEPEKVEELKPVPRKSALSGYKIPKKPRSSVSEENSLEKKRGSSPLSPLTSLISPTSTTNSYMRHSKTSIVRDLMPKFANHKNHHQQKSSLPIPPVPMKPRTIPELKLEPPPFSPVTVNLQPEQKLLPPQLAMLVQNSPLPPLRMKPRTAQKLPDPLAPIKHQIALQPPHKVRSNESYQWRTMSTGERVEVPEEPWRQMHFHGGHGQPYLPRFNNSHFRPWFPNRGGCDRRPPLRNFFRPMTNPHT